MRLEVYFLKNVIDQNVCIFCQKTTIMKKIVLKNFEKKIKKERKNIFKKNVDQIEFHKYICVL